MNKGFRVVVGLLTAFVGITAVGGGAAILLGVDQFPQAWLQDTLFSNFTLPALVLAGVVGGSACVASVSIVTNRQLAPIAALVAGVLLMGFIGVEVLTLKQTPPGPTVIEAFYLIIGLVIVLLSGVWLRRSIKSVSPLGV